MNSLKLKFASFALFAAKISVPLCLCGKAFYLLNPLYSGKTREIIRLA